MIFKPLVLLKDNYLQEIQGERLTHGPSKFDPKLKTLGVLGFVSGLLHGVLNRLRNPKFLARSGKLCIYPPLTESKHMLQFCV